MAKWLAPTLTFDAIPQPVPLPPVPLRRASAPLVRLPSALSPFLPLCPLIRGAIHAYITPRVGTFAGSERGISVKSALSTATGPRLSYRPAISADIEIATRGGWLAMTCRYDCFGTRGTKVATEKQRATDRRGEWEGLRHRRNCKHGAGLDSRRPV